MTRKVVLVASIVVQYDAISQIVRNLYSYLSGLKDIEVVLLTAECGFDDMRVGIVGDAGKLICHPDFLDADLIIYNFGIYNPLFDACLVGNGRAVQVCYFQNITPAEFLPPQYAPVIRQSFVQVHNFKKADRLWAASEFNASTLLELGMDGERIDLVPNAVDNPPLCQLADKQRETIQIVFVGRAVESKGLLDAIEAFSRVHAQFPSAILTIAFNVSQSDPDYLKRCKASIKAFGLNKAALFEESPDNERLYCLYRRSHILLLPTSHEGFCLPVVEALRAGAIPVGYDAGNMRYVVDGFGRLVPRGDREALSAALTEIVADLHSLAGDPVRGSIRLDRAAMPLADFDHLAKRHVGQFMSSRIKSMVVSHARQLLASGKDAAARLLPTQQAGTELNGAGGVPQPIDPVLAIRPEVQVIPDDLMRERSRVSLNRLPDASDWDPGNELTDIMRSMHQPICIHRKAWEYAICIQGLRQLGVVHENATALSVGAGSEPPLYYFANHIKKMIATDLYDNVNHEGTPAMLADPDAFAPFSYRKDRLEVLRMPGDQLDFPDRTFDFIFTLSSIEHFGSREIQRRSVDEMARVLKPGGVACIITEMILSGGTDREYFRLEEIQDIFLSHPSLELVGGEIDLSISQSHVDYPVNLVGTKFLNKSPHIVLRRDGLRWTSLSLFLRRRADATEGDNALGRLIQLPGLPAYMFHTHDKAIDQYISGQIGQSGTWEVLETEIVRRLLGCYRTFLDLGANVGWYARLAKAVIGADSEIFAFEPEPRNFALLQKNVGETGASIHLLQMAISDSSGTISLHLSDTNQGDHRIYASEQGRSAISVPMMTLDAFLDGRVIGPCLLKSDTQGSEPKILRGASKALAPILEQTSLILEFWPHGMSAAGEDVFAFIDSLSALPHRALIIDNGNFTLTPVTFDALAQRCRTDLAPDTGLFIDLLLVPPDSPAYAAIADLITVEA